MNKAKGTCVGSVHNIATVWSIWEYNDVNASSSGGWT